MKLVLLKHYPRTYEAVPNVFNSFQRGGSSKMASSNCNFCSKVGSQPISNDRTTFNYTCLEVKKKEKRKKGEGPEDQVNQIFFWGGLGKFTVFSKFQNLPQPLPLVCIYNLYHLDFFEVNKLLRYIITSLVK